jgi:c-di-GMP-binding flagellar brake protein YcgR
VSRIEKRKIERFDLELPIYLRISDKDKKREPLKFITSNICSGGAFFKTEKPLSVGTDVKLDIILPLNKFKNVKSKISHIDVSGSVIRTDQQGMAICFDKNYKISSY